MVIFGLDKIGFLNFSKKYTYYLSNPISFGIYRTYQGVLQQFQFIYNLRNAAQQNVALKVNLDELMTENASLRKRLSEAETQIIQQNYLDPKNYYLTAARPIGLARHLKIDKGSSQGIKEGQVAVFKDNYIGKIVQVSEGNALLQLPSDPSSKLSAFSLGLEGRARGVVTGQFGTEILMEKILHEEKIQQGDLVYSEGLEDFLPRGLILGKVVEVNELPNEVFKTARIEPLFDTKDLDLVFVIRE